MAPSHVVFGDDGAQAPKYASTSAASPSTSKRGANPNGTPLSTRPRVAHFTEEDEEDRAGLRKASAAKEGKGKGKLAQEREMRKVEADRLKPGRIQLPIYGGECAFPGVDSW